MRHGRRTPRASARRPLRRGPSQTPPEGPLRRRSGGDIWKISSGGGFDRDGDAERARRGRPGQAGTRARRWPLLSVDRTRLPAHPPSPTGAPYHGRGPLLAGLAVCASSRRGHLFARALCHRPCGHVDLFTKPSPRPRRHATAPAASLLPGPTPHQPRSHHDGARHRGKAHPCCKPRRRGDVDVTGRRHQAGAEGARR